MHAVKELLRQLGAGTPLGAAFLSAALGLLCYILTSAVFARVLRRGLVRPELSPEEDYDDSTEEETEEEETTEEEPEEEEPEEEDSESALRADVVVCVAAGFFMRGGANLIKAVGMSCAEAFRVIVLIDPRAPASRAQKIHRAIAGVPNGARFVTARALSGRDKLGAVLRFYGAHLYLGERPKDVAEALAAGVASANMHVPKPFRATPANELRVALDGDAVIFSDEAEQVFQRDGLAAFLDYEARRAHVPLRPGPFHVLLRALGNAQRRVPLKTYLVTARGHGPEKVRAINSLTAAGLRLDEMVFCDGSPKGPVLARIAPHVFFDDTHRNVDGAIAAGILAGQVPYDAWRPAESNAGAR